MNNIDLYKLKYSKYKSKYLEIKQKNLEGGLGSKITGYVWFFIDPLVLYGYGYGIDIRQDTLNPYIYGVRDWYQSPKNLSFDELFKMSLLVIPSPDGENPEDPKK